MLELLPGDAAQKEKSNIIYIYIYIFIYIYIRERARERERERACTAKHTFISQKDDTLSLIITQMTHSWYDADFVRFVMFESYVTGCNWLIPASQISLLRFLCPILTHI